jgi:hypothetical protein
VEVVGELLVERPDADQHRRPGPPRLLRSVAARELAEVFTPTGEEVSWARAKTTTDQHCLALLVLR